MEVTLKAFIFANLFKPLEFYLTLPSGFLRQDRLIFKNKAGLPISACVIAYGKIVEKPASLQLQKTFFLA